MLGLKEQIHACCYTEEHQSSMIRAEDAAQGMLGQLACDAECAVPDAQHAPGVLRVGLPQALQQHVGPEALGRRLRDKQSMKNCRHCDL